MQLQKPSSAMMKLAHEDCHRKGRPRVTSVAEDKFMSYLPQKLQPKQMLQSSSNRHISTSTVQMRLRVSGLNGQIAAKEPLLKNTNKKRLAWAKKHEH